MDTYPTLRTLLPLLVFKTMNVKNCHLSGAPNHQTTKEKKWGREEKRILQNERKKSYHDFHAASGCVIKIKGNVVRIRVQPNAFLLILSSARHIAFRLDSHIGPWSVSYHPLHFAPLLSPERKICKEKTHSHWMSPCVLWWLRYITAHAKVQGTKERVGSRAHSYR